ncbi:hypothetical protein AAMO2058_000580600 [Amorphochlora amoebiformis]
MSVAGQAEDDGASDIAWDQRSMNSLAPDVEVELAIMGPPKVGKTALLERWIDQKHKTEYNATNGCNARVNILTIEDSFVKVKVLDASGSKRHLPIIKGQLKGKTGCMICFSSSIAESFEESKSWLEIAKQNCEQDCKVAFLECQSDLNGDPRIFQEAKAFASKNDYAFYRTSAKTGENVESALRNFVRRMLGKEEEDPVPFPSMNKRQTLKGALVVEEIDTFDDEPEAEMTAGQKSQFKEGQLVQYKSVSAGGWVDTKVIGFQLDGRIDLEVRKGADPSRVRAIDDEDRKKRDQWKVGSVIEVYSSSKGQWLPTKITAITRDKGGQWLSTPLKPVRRYNRAQCRDLTEDGKRILEEMAAGSRSPISKSLNSKSPRATDYLSAPRGSPRSPKKYQTIVAGKSGGLTDINEQSPDEDKYIVGQQVLYYSSSANRWIRATIQKLNADKTVNLDVRSNADRARIKAYPKSSGLDDSKHLDIKKLQTVQNDLKRLKKLLEETQKVNDDLQNQAAKREAELKGKVTDLNNKLKLMRNGEGGKVDVEIQDLKETLAMEKAHHKQTKSELQMAIKTQRKMEESVARKRASCRSCSVFSSSI